MSNRPTHLSEHDRLHQRMLAGEEEAFVDFAREFGPRLRGYFLKKGVDAAVAEDLAVGCLEDVFLHPHKYSSEHVGSFVGWLFTIAKNRFLDWRRRNPDASSSVLLDHVPRRETPSVDGSVAVAVSEALAQLDEVDQEIVRLADMGETLTAAEIGRALEMKAGAVRTRASRARKRLRAILAVDTRIQDWLARRTAEGEADAC